MKRIKLFEQFIDEENATARYYREHPEKIAKFDNVPTKASFGKEEKKGFGPRRRSENPVDIKRKEFIERFKEKHKELYDKLSSTKFNEKAYRDDTLWTDMVKNENMFREGPIAKNTWEEAKKAANSWVIEDMLPAAEELLSKHWPVLAKAARQLKIMKAVSWNYDDAKFKKEALQRGVDRHSLELADLWITDFTSMSRKKLPEDVWPLLKKLTVNANELPEYVYRGIFVDGVKVKDKEAFLKKWAKGSKPKVSQGKATSWSASKRVAAQFMDTQDFIKDMKNGYHVLLKLKVDPKHVIADLRNYDTKFWNQQEIIISPEAKDYEVAEIIPYEPYDKEHPSKHQQFTNKNSAANGGAWGVSKDEMSSDILNVFNMDIPAGEKEKWKLSKDLTVDQFRKKYNTQINDWPENKVGKALMPLWAFVRTFNQRGWTFKVWPVKDLERESAELGVSFTVELKWYNSRNDSVTTLIMKELGLKKDDKNEKNEFKIPYGMSLKAVQPLKVTMTQNAINQFKFDVVVPELEFSELEEARIGGPPKPEELENAQKVIEIMKKHKDFVRKEAIQNFEKTFTEYFPKNVKVTIK